MRIQKGYIWLQNRIWYGRWREPVLQPDGTISREQRSRKLVERCDRYRSKSDVQPLLDEILKPLNEGRVNGQCTQTVTRFVESFYLPYAKENCKPSTFHGYSKLWRSYLVPGLADVVLRDFRCVDAAKLLAQLHREHGPGRTSLRHVKSLLSGIFTYAKNLGVLDGINPVRDALIPKKAAAPKETHATSTDEALAILDAVSGHLQARAAVALAFFAGLRPCEVRGVRWEDLDGNRLSVQQSVWHTYTTEPKTEGSKKPIPVIEPLRTILTELREAEGNPVSGPILRGEKLGRPLNLDNLARRVIVPALKAGGLQWRGWQALRRGIATLVRNVAKDPMAAKGLLRHSSVNTTLGYYIKDVPEVTLRAMQVVEELCNHRATGQSSRAEQVH